MKRNLILALFITGFGLMACDNATDGDADTDTTDFPTDIYGDTTNTINTNTGTYPDTLIQVPAGQNQQADTSR